MENLWVLVQRGWSHLSRQDALCTQAAQQLPETLFKIYFLQKGFNLSSLSSWAVVYYLAHFLHFGDC